MKLIQYLLNQETDIMFDLFSADEEHEIATITENPIYNWDIDFQNEWRDVLESEIVSFLPETRNDVIKITVSGVAAKRIEKFQFIMAGYGPESYWLSHHLEVKE